MSNVDATTEWKHLVKTGYYHVLLRYGYRPGVGPSSIRTVEQFCQLIEKRKLIAGPGGTYCFSDEGEGVPGLIGAGAKFWATVFAVLDRGGFDWRSHVVNREILAPIKHIERLELRPGDILFVRCQERFSVEAYERMKHQLSDIFPAHKVVILENGVEIGVINPGGGEL